MATGVIRERKRDTTKNGEEDDSNLFRETKKSEGAVNGRPVPSKKEDKQWVFTREDVLAWVLGLLFIAVLIWMVFIVGDLRMWNAQSGYTHNVTANSIVRFLPEPFVQEDVRGRSGPDAPGRWYYWKLNRLYINAWTRVFPWAGYTLHQIIIWISIYMAQNAKRREPENSRFTTSMRTFNWLALFSNVLFHILHFINTHVTYDALAQDVSIASSQSSVVVILMLVMIMEYRDRGLLFGWPLATSENHMSRMATLSYVPGDIIRRYHGYAFAWAAVYTFWYHPMENTLGHVTGAFYTWIVLLQGSLMYTKLHLNPYWRQLLEVWVVVHGGVVAAQTGGPELGGTRLWPMFTFGFAFVWVLSQIHGLPFWKKLKPVWKFLPLAVFLLVTVWSYSWILDASGRPFTRIHEIIRLPITYYIYFLFGWASLYGLVKIQQRLGKTTIPGGPARSRVFLGLAVSVYVVHILLGVAAEYGDIKMRLTMLSLLFDALFVFGCALSFIFLDEALQLTKR